jgi:predicted nucleotidyltransferase
MDEQTIRRVIQNYLKILREAGIQVDRAILFGSHARRKAHADSDIDIIVIAPEFDEPNNDKWVNLLWELRAKSDSRIEPYPVGQRQWQEDDSSAIIEIAQREGKEIHTTIAV